MSVEKLEKRPNTWQEKLNWYLSIIVLALLTIAPPILCGLFYLSQVPDITWKHDDGLTLDRIWMHRERRPLGIGYQGQHVLYKYSDTEVCLETKLRFFLWGESRIAEPGTRNQKMILIDGDWQPTGERC